MGRKALSHSVKL